MISSLWRTGFKAIRTAGRGAVFTALLDICQRCYWSSAGKRQKFWHFGTYFNIFTGSHFMHFKTPRCVAALIPHREEPTNGLTNSQALREKHTWRAFNLPKPVDADAGSSHTSLPNLGDPSDESSSTSNLKKKKKHPKAKRLSGSSLFKQEMWGPCCMSFFSVKERTKQRESCI